MSITLSWSKFVAVLLLIDGMPFASSDSNVLINMYEWIYIVLLINSPDVLAHTDTLTDFVTLSD